MTKIFKIVGLTLFMIILLFFIMPMSHKGFEELYTGEKSIRVELEEFRNYPTKQISINNLDWSYYDSGKGEETILFLHGMGGSYDIWFQQIIALKTDFRILAVTYPEAETLEEMATAIISILDIEEIEKVHVVGTSLGGYLTQFLLKKYPHRLNKVVIGNSFPPNHQFLEKNGKLANVLPSIPEWLLMRTFRKNIKNKVVPAANDNPLVEAYLLEQDYGIMTKQQFISRLNCVLQYFEPMRPADISNEMLIIESDNDPLIPAQLRGSLKLLYPASKVYTFNNTGHFTYLNEPTAYTKLLRSFLESNKDLESEKITDLIQNFYFEGRKQGNIEMLAHAFDDNAKLVTVKNKNRTDTSLKEYLKIVQTEGGVECKTRILDLDIEGSIAMVKSRFDYGAVTYTDFLSLIKVNNEWKIISKLYIKD